jgi:hypothetical protein
MHPPPTGNQSLPQGTSPPLSNRFAPAAAAAKQSLSCFDIIWYTNDTFVSDWAAAAFNVARWSCTWFNINLFTNKMVILKIFKGTDDTQAKQGNDDHKELREVGGG